ncbi:MAG: hypothetical protein KAI24_06115 [Planctomycetes bacterium]|nr:hypothetical protein [Planctomycetota bacterium]
MSTNPENPQANEPPPEESFDELTGVYGFFRRHQKKLLYTAGLFTLLTFSITGSLQGLVGGMFSKDIERGSIEVNGTRADLTSEDYDYGTLIARHLGNRTLPPGVILPVSAGEGGDNELAEVFAILRRAAIIEGFEPSMAEVERSIQATRELYQVESAAKLANRFGFASLAEMNRLVAEAMRIGMYQRLQVLAADTSDAEVMRQVLRDEHKATYRVAVFDAEKRQEELQAASELSDEDLNTWLAEQTDAEKRRMNVFDLPRVKLRIGAVLLGEGQFDASQWQEGPLKDFDASEDQLRSYYDSDRDRWKVEGTEDEYREFEDEAVQQELLAMVQAERVMNDLNEQLKARLAEEVKPFSDKVAEAQNDFDSANASRNQTLQEKLQKEKALVMKEAELAEKPDDADLKAAVETAKAEAQAAKDADFAEEQRLTQMQQGLDNARADETRARVGFDFAAEFNKLVEGKTGFVVKETAELHTAEQLADLDELGLGLGTWSTANAATAIRDAGSIGYGPGRTSKGAIIYQVVEADPQPLKPWEELKPLVEEAYWSKKANDEVVEKDKAMKETILRLAKEQMPDFVKEKEDSRQSRIDEQLTEWEQEVEAAIAKAEKMLATPNLGDKARTAWQSTLDAKKNELAGKDSKRKSVEALVDQDIKNEIGAEALKHYAAVLDAAAAELGYEVREIGPLPQKLSSRPRFEDSHDKVTRYVFRFQSEMEEGDAVGPIYDRSSRMSQVIVCTKVEPLTPADITRREFQRRRNNFATLQMYNVQATAFTPDALAERYRLVKPVGELVEPQ